MEVELDSEKAQPLESVLADQWGLGWAPGLERVTVMVLGVVLAPKWGLASGFVSAKSWVPRWGSVLALLLALLTASAAVDTLQLDQPIDSGVNGPPPNSTVWTDALTLGVHGRGWPQSQMSSPYTRLPAHAQNLLCSTSR